jgi:hypothetical protein
MAGMNISKAAGTYQLRVRGYLDQRWSEWFDGFEIIYCDEDTILTGSVPDQAALHGILAKIGDLGLFIVCVEYLDHKGGKNEAS